MSIPVVFSWMLFIFSWIKKIFTRAQSPAVNQTKICFDSEIPSKKKPSFHSLTRLRPEITDDSGIWKNTGKRKEENSKLKLQIDEFDEDYYRVLDLDQEASQAEIRQAYKNNLVHPDKIK